MQKSTDKPAIYISYAWGSESEAIAEAVEKEFEKRGLPIIRDKNVLGYKGRIKAFMEQIGRAKYIILVIGNKYLHSANCMFELIQIFKNEHFYDRIFPVVLDEVNIYDASERVRLMKYWEDKTESLNDEIRELRDFTNIQGITDDLNLTSEIRDNIARLTDILKDTNTLTVQELRNSRFEPLYSAIQRKIKTDGKQKTDQKVEKKVSGGTIGSAEHEDKKRKFGVIQRVVLAIVFLFVAFAVFQGVKDDGSTEEKKDSIDSAIVAAKKEDSLQQLNDRLKKDSVINTVPANDKKPSKTESKITYDVELVVPSYMAKADVYVDNRAADIIDRSPISITVRLNKKESSHHFKITDGTDTCFTNKLISKDKIRLTPCD